MLSQSLSSFPSRPAHQVGVSGMKLSKVWQRGRSYKCWHTKASSSQNFHSEEMFSGLSDCSCAWPLYRHRLTSRDCLHATHTHIMNLRKWEHSVDQSVLQAGSQGSYVGEVHHSASEILHIGVWLQKAPSISLLIVILMPLRALRIQRCMMVEHRISYDAAGELIYHFPSLVFIVFS